MKIITYNILESSFGLLNETLQRLDLDPEEREKLDLDPEEREKLEHVRDDYANVMNWLNTRV